MHIDELLDDYAVLKAKPKQPSLQVHKEKLDLAYIIASYLDLGYTVSTRYRETRDMFHAFPPPLAIKQKLLKYRLLRSRRNVFSRRPNSAADYFTICEMYEACVLDIANSMTT